MLKLQVSPATEALFSSFAREVYTQSSGRASLISVIYDLFEHISVHLVCLLRQAVKIVPFQIGTKLPSMCLSVPLMWYERLVCR